MPIGLDLQQLADHGKYVELTKALGTEIKKKIVIIHRLCSTKLTHSRVQ